MQEYVLYYVTDFFLKAYQWTIVVCIKRSTMEHMFLFLIKCDSSKPASSAMFFFKSVSHNVLVLILFIIFLEETESVHLLFNYLFFFFWSEVWMWNCL